MKAHPSDESDDRCKGAVDRSCVGDCVQHHGGPKDLQHSEADAGAHCTREQLAPREVSGRKRSVTSSDDGDVDEHSAERQQDSVEPRDAADADDSGDDGGADLGHAHHSDSEERANSACSDGRPLMVGDLPNVVDCGLRKHKRFCAGPQASTESDYEHHHVAVKIGRVHAQCLADDWDVGQRRVDDAIAQPRIALQYETQNGGEHQ